MTQDSGLPELQSVLDNPSFAFFWSFVSTWLAFCKDPNADKERYLSEQMKVASGLGLRTTPVGENGKANDVDRSGIEPGTDVDPASNSKGQ